MYTFSHNFAAETVYRNVNRVTCFKLPKTLIREYRIEGVSEDGTTHTLHVTDNRQRFLRHSVDWRVKRVTLVPIATHGCDSFRLFDFELNNQ